MSFNGKGYMRSIQQKLGIVGTISKFACRLRKTRKMGVEMDARRAFRVHTVLMACSPAKITWKSPLTRVLLLQVDTRLNYI
jgi:hypothetical protein